MLVLWVKGLVQTSESINAVEILLSLVLSFQISFV